MKKVEFLEKGKEGIYAFCWLSNTFLGGECCCDGPITIATAIIAAVFDKPLVISSKDVCLNGIESVKKNAPIAKVAELK